MSQGSGLGRVDRTDYVVDIGEGECEITEIFDNLIICEPPPDIKQTGDDTEISRQRLVKVGFWLSKNILIRPHKINC